MDRRWLAAPLRCNNSLPLAKAPKRNAEIVLRRGPLQRLGRSRNGFKQLAVNSDCLTQRGIIRTLVAMPKEGVGLPREKSVVAL
jgi:hypothetical protein